MARLAGIVIVIGGITLLSARAPIAQPAPAFEVASVKPIYGDAALRNQFTPGRAFFGNSPVRLLISFTYGVPSDRMIGGPAWIDTERFDVVATHASEGTPFSRLRLMMQALLRDRFALRVRQDVQDRPVYQLVRARPDGQLGPNHGGRLRHP